MMDRWAFGMSRIEAKPGTDGESKSGERGSRAAPATSQPEELVKEVGNVSIVEEEKKDTRSGFTGRAAAQGPSLLSQQAPVNVGGSASTTKVPPIPISPQAAGSSSGGERMSMSVDGDSAVRPFTRGGDGLDVFEDGETGGEDDADWEAAAEKITVKIADLGNGMPIKSFLNAPLIIIPTSHLDRTPLHR